MSAVPVLGFGLFAVLLVAHLVSPAAREWTWKVAAVAGALWVLTGAWVGLAWAPADSFMGDVQRILYVHVPVLWVGLLALALNFASALAYLFTSRRGPDALAEASAEVGVVFGFIGLGIGAIWGKPTWGVWWSWDPRMTATTVMLLLYTAYLAVRRFTDDPEARAFRSATVACLVSVVLPVVWYSVRWFASLHQQQSTRDTMDPRMLLALGWSFAGFLLLFFALTWQRTLLALRSGTANRSAGGDVAEE